MDAGMAHTLHPGPIDNSILTLQERHRSTEIWNGQDFEPLTCRRCDGHFWRLGPLDPRVQKVLLTAGFYGVYKAGRIRLDHALITALVERWRPETHTFHFPVGEATVTLQDIAVLWGLPVDGDPITGVDTNRSMDEWQEICNELLGFRPPPEDFDRGRLKIRCLQERFKTLPDDASEDTVQFYARAYILQLLGGQLLSDMSNNKVKLMYLPLLRDFETAGTLSWGSAVLACLYRALCRATKPETSDICGPLVLLQIWAWERIPFIRPGRLAPRLQPIHDLVSGEQHLPAAPYGSRWNVGFKLESVGTHVLVLYRDQIDNMKDDQFIWIPYPGDVLASLPEYCLSGSRIWQTVAPLICFDVVEFHHPDRALRQFGQKQNIPAICDTIQDIHFTDRRGRQNYDWANHHRQYVDMWEDRFVRVVSASPLDCPMDPNDSYMVWYRQITRLLIGNPASRPNTRYHGGSMEAMVQSLQRIYNRASEGIQEGYEVSGEDVLREIQDICVYSLRAAHEDHRLTVRQDMDSPSPSASTFMMPPKAQRGRPRKRGGFVGGQATDSRRRFSYLPASSQLTVANSPMTPNVLPPSYGDMADTPQTWDSSMSASEFHDAADQNTMQLDSEDSTNPFLQALGKIRDICACTLRMGNGDQAVLSSQDMFPVGSKTKRCRPRRRGGMTGYPLGASSGLNAYYPCTPGQESPTPSASFGLNGSPLHVNDIRETNFETLVTPLSRDSPISELHDNLQSEMIELDTITGSREASPSMMNLPCDASANENTPPILMDAVSNPLQVTGHEEEDIGRVDEILPPACDDPASVSCASTIKPDSDNPEKCNETHFPEGERIDSMPCEPDCKESTVHLDPNGLKNHSISEPPASEPQVTENPAPSDSANHEKDDMALTHQVDRNIPEPSLEQYSFSNEQLTRNPSPKPQASSVPSISDEPVTKTDDLETDSAEVITGKRKGESSDKASPTNSSQTLDTVASCHYPDSVHDSYMSQVNPSLELESDVAVKEESPKRYKRQRRSVPKQSSSSSTLT